MSKYLRIAWLVIFSTAICCILLIAQEQVKTSTESINALTEAVTLGDIDEVRRLFEAGADANVMIGNQVTPLFLASLKGHKEIVKLLLDAGAEVNKKVKDDFTGLHVASLNDHGEVVKLLLEAGANVNARTKSMYDKASLRPAMNRVATIIRAYSIFGSSNNFPVFDYGPSLTSYSLIKHGLGEHSPLMLASANGHSEVVRLLLEAGTNVNLEANTGDTALHLASKNGHTEIVEMLLDAGAK